MSYRSFSQHFKFWKLKNIVLYMMGKRTRKAHFLLRCKHFRACKQKRVIPSVYYWEWCICWTDCVRNLLERVLELTGLSFQLGNFYYSFSFFFLLFPKLKKCKKWNMPRCTRTCTTGRVRSSHWIYSPIWSLLYAMYNIQ